MEPISTDIDRDYRARGAYHQKCGEARGSAKKAKPTAMHDMKLQKIQIGIIQQEWMIMIMNRIMPEELVPIDAIDHLVDFDYWNDRVAEL